MIHAQACISTVHSLIGDSIKKSKYKNLLFQPKITMHREIASPTSHHLNTDTLKHFLINFGSIQCLQLGERKHKWKTDKQ